MEPSELHEKPSHSLDNMSSILYLGSSRFSEIMNTERWQLTQGMLREGHFIFHDLSQSDQGTDLHALWIQYQKPDVVLLEDYDWAHKFKLPIHFTNTEKVTVPIWCFIADYWYDPNEKRDYYKSNRIQGLVAIHESANAYISKHFGSEIQRTINIPFSVDRNDFSEDVQPKLYDVLCSGFVGDLYPLRLRLQTTLKKNHSIHTHFLEHPGYWKKNENIGRRGRDYYALMEQSRLVISTTGIYNISVRKHIEIVGSRAKILGNTTGFPEHTSFERFVVHLSQELSDVEMTQRIENALSDWMWSGEDEYASKVILESHDALRIARSLHAKLEMA